MSGQNSNENRFAALCCRIAFAERYYEYCDRHLVSGHELPVPLQEKALEETGWLFRYQRKGKYFKWMDRQAEGYPPLGLNVDLRMASVEWILNVETPAGGLGGTFAGMALRARRLTTPGYQHDPPYPTPCFANMNELAVVLTEGFALYEDLAAAIRAETWA